MQLNECLLTVVVGNNRTHYMGEKAMINLVFEVASGIYDPIPPSHSDVFAPLISDKWCEFMEKIEVIQEPTIARIEIDFNAKVVRYHSLHIAPDFMKSDYFFTSVRNHLFEIDGSYITSDSIYSHLTEKRLYLLDLHAKQGFLLPEKMEQCIPFAENFHGIPTLIQIKLPKPWKVRELPVEFLKVDAG